MATLAALRAAPSGMSRAAPGSSVPEIPVTLRGRTVDDSIAAGFEGDTAPDASTVTITEVGTENDTIKLHCA
ncbi:MAG: hypothetical protein V8R48_14175 [Eggerthella lenta]